MNLIKNKKAMGLPMVLGIVVFVIGISVSLLSYITFQSRLVEIDIKQTEDYQNAVSQLDAAVQIIAREQNLDEQFLADIATYFELEIRSYNESVYAITSMVNNNDQIISYMTGSAGASDVYENLFSYTGEENDFRLSPLITPSNMLAKVLPTFIETNFSWITPETEFRNFKEIMRYVERLAKQNNGFEYYKPEKLEEQWQPTAWWHWYIDGDVEIENGDKKNSNYIRNLRVPDGRVLFINGDLTMHEGSTIYGNVVINGDLEIKGKGNSEQGIEGTIYLTGELESDKNLRLGTVDRPTFIFSEDEIDLDKNVFGYGYFLAEEFDAKHKENNIIGGVYVTDEAKLPKGGITANDKFDISKLYEFNIPTTIDTENPSSGNTGKTFKYTSPKLK